MEAVICSAAAAMTFAGLASFLLGTITQLLGIPVSAAEDPRLQLGYVISILLLNGIVAGTALGVLRWRIVREQPTQPVPLPQNLSWTKDLRSQLIWIAGLRNFPRQKNIASSERAIRIAKVNLGLAEEQPA